MTTVTRIDPIAKLLDDFEAMFGRAPKPYTPRPVESLAEHECCYIADCREGAQDPVEQLSNDDCRDLLGSVYLEFTRSTWSQSAVSDAARLRAIGDLMASLEGSAAVEMTARRQA